MEDIATQTGRGPGTRQPGTQHLSTQERVERWWPVAVGLAGVMVLPLLGIPFALVMSFLRRWDRPVMVTLLVIAALGVFLLSLVLGAGGDGVGTGG